MGAGLNPTLTRELIEFALSSSGAPRRWHITRLAMYRALEATLAGEDSAERVVLSISKSGKLARTMGLAKAQIVDASYPEHDLLDLKSFEDKSMDFLVADQVLEHVAGDPFTAFSESARVVKPGGFVVHTTCMTNPIHQAPLDFWRFTPAALRMLAERSGLKVRTVEGWGNRDAWDLIAMGFRGTRIPEDDENPLYQLALRNDPANAIVTWVVAQRPAES